MKKTIIFSIILMPIIVLGILLFSGDIVNRTTHLYVEDVEFVENTVVLDKTSDAEVSKILSVNVYPMLATNKEVEFWSADESIVTIDEDGVVTSVGFGETYVYVKSKENGAKMGYCKVVVTSERVHYLKIKNPVDTIYVGDTHVLSVDCYPKEAKDVALYFKSSDADILEVGLDGTLIPKKKGSVTVEAVLKSNEKIKAQMTVNVKVPVEGIYVEDGGDVVSGLNGFTFPEVKFYPSDSLEDIKYFSSNEEVATVDEVGNITFIKAGEVEISAGVLSNKFVVKKKYRSTTGFVDGVEFDDSKNTLVYNFEEWEGKALPISWGYFPKDADENNLSFKSDNQNVLQVRGKQIFVVGGGSANITLTGKISDNKRVSKTLTFKIERKVQSITFGLDDFVYTTQSFVDLNMGFETADATEEITLEVSDESVAEIKNGKLYFKQSAIENKFGKVTVTAKTSNIEKRIVVAYVAEEVTAKNIENQTAFTFYMPYSTSTSKTTFRFVDDFTGYTDLHFNIISGDGVVSQNGYVFTAQNKGSAKVGVYKNGESQPVKIITIQVVRLVESINNLSVKATWNGTATEKLDASKAIYSSSKTFNISYDLYPQNTTLQEAQVSVSDESVASFENGVLTFKKAGAVTLTLTADDAEPVTVKISSTYEMPDDKISVIDKLTLDKDNDETKSVWELITISPSGASKNNFAFTVIGDAVSINDDGKIEAQKGGTSTIKVEIAVVIVDGNLTVQKTITKEIEVTVFESGEVVALKNSDQFIYSDDSKISVFDRFEVLPASANKNNEITFSVDDDSVASIGGNGVLTFKKAGKSVVTATLTNGEVAKITVVYVGNAIRVEEKDFPCKILKGTTVAIIPNGETLVGASYDAKFVVKDGNAVIENGVFVTVNGNATISFSGKDFSFECVEINGVALNPKSNGDYDVINGKNITGLKSLYFNGVVSGINGEYVTTTYSVSGTAMVSQDGKLTFTKKGEAKITFEVCYNQDIVGATGKYKYASFVIESTYGEILSITAKEPSVTIDFNNENLEENVVNIKDYIEIKPSQIEISEESVSIQSSNKEIATVNGLNANLCKGGQFTLSAYAKGNSKVVATVSVLVNRSATAIYMNGKELSENVEINKSSFFVTPSYYPSDASVNNAVSWEVVEGEGTVANVNGNRITFVKANETVKIKFSLKSQDGLSVIKEYLVNYQTDTITFEVDVKAETFVVPTGVPFSFVSEDGSAFSVDFGTLAFTEISDGVYRLDTSVNDKINLTKDGSTVEKAFISTLSIGEITGVKVKDYDLNGEEKQVLAVESERALTTASQSVKILYDMPVGYDKYGNLVAYSVSVLNDIQARVENNTVIFSEAGTATIKITISFEDAEGQRGLSFEFSIESTYKTVLDFELDKSEIKNLTYNSSTNTFESLIFDNLTEAQKYIDLSSALIRVAPIYGKEVDGVKLSSSNDGVAIIENGKIKIVGAGHTTITINWGKETQTIAFTVEKYIDRLAFVSSGKQYLQTVTKLERYPLDYKIFNDVGIEPTLVDVAFTSDDCTIVNGVANLSSANKKYVITITAVYGKENAKATATLEIIRVSENVEIVPVDGTVSSITLHKAKSGEVQKQYVLAFDFDGQVVGIEQIDGTPLAIENESIGLIQGVCGGECAVTLNNGRVLSVVVTEDVENILFNDEIDYLTALGDKNDGNQIVLSTYFGMKIYPSTARDKSGVYEFAYSVSDSSIASIESIDGEKCLVFNKQGEVTIYFTAGGVTKEQKIRSTMGYAYSAELLSGTDLNFDKQNPQNLNLNREELFSVLPLNAYKDSPSYISDNEEVLTIDGQTITLVGGGKCKINVKVTTGENQYLTLKKGVYVVNRADNTSIKRADGTLTGYQVFNTKKGDTEALDLSIVSDGALSDYTIVAESSSASLTVDVIKYQLSQVRTFALSNYKTVNYRLKITPTTDTKVNAYITIYLEYSNGEKIEYSKINVLCDPNYTVQTVQKDNSSSSFASLDLSLEKDETVVLQPISESVSTAFDFAVISGNGVVTVNAYGEITKIGSGKAVISIKDANGFQEEITVYVVKKASITLEENDIVTAKSEWEIAHSLSENDTLFEKEISYVSSDESVASVSGASLTKDENGTVTSLVKGGLITFKKAGSVNITITITNTRTGEKEAEKTFTIRSTFGVVESFDLSEQSLTLDSDGTALIKVYNTYPSDHAGSVENLIVSSSTSAFEVVNISIAEDGKYQFEIVGKQGGNSYASVEFLGLTKRIEVTVIQVATDIEIQQNGTTVTEIATFKNTATLSALLKPIGTVANKTVVWEITQGNASVNNGVVTFGAFGTVVVKATSGDGRCYKTLTINYLEDITDFDVVVNGAVVNNGTVYLDFNQNELAVSVKTNVSGFENLSGFILNGSSLSSFGATKLSVSGGTTWQLSYSVADWQATPYVEQKVVVKYSSEKTEIEKEFTVIREGVSSIEFYDATNNTVLSNDTDGTYGLQSVRVFGNKSYYDGVQNYYKMKLFINGGVTDNVNFLNSLNWVVSVNGVSYSFSYGDLSETTANSGIVYLNFSGYSGGTVEEIYADNFANSRVTITAITKSGKVSYSYTFHIVTGVNVYDKDGYASAETSVMVMQTNFGHDDQKDKEGYVYLDTYVQKTTVYGNGYMLNLAYRNNKTPTKEEDGETAYNNYKSYGYISLSVNNMINVNFYGANASTSRDENRLEFVHLRKMAYCELYYMFRSVQHAYGYDTKIKNTSFVSFQECGIIKPGSSGNLFLENVVMFDVGSRAIEVQQGNVYLSGDIKIYNFQNKKTLDDLVAVIGSSVAKTIINKAKDEGVTVSAYDLDWVNMVGISTKRDSSNVPEIWYAPNAGSTEGATKDLSALNIKKIENTYNLVLKKYYIDAWVFTNVNGADAIKVTDEYSDYNSSKSSGTLNTSNMASQIETLKRTRKEGD